MQKYIILNLYQPIDMYERLSRAKKKKIYESAKCRPWSQTNSMITRLEFN